MNKKATNNIKFESAALVFVRVHSVFSFIRNCIRMHILRVKCRPFGKKCKTEENVNNWNMLCAVWCFRGVIIGHDEMANNNAQRIGICDRFIPIHSQSIYFFPYAHTRARSEKTINKPTKWSAGLVLTHWQDGTEYICIVCTVVCAIHVNTD